MAKYIETRFVNYHSNVVGDAIQSTHPDKIELPDGELVDVSGERRYDLIEKDWCKNQNSHSKNGGYIKIENGVRFRVISQWENDCNSNGNRIRWEVPKGSRLLWTDGDDDVIDDRRV